MDELNKQEIIKRYIKEICHYSQKQVFATSVYQKKFLQYQIDDASDELTDFLLIHSETPVYRQQLQSGQQQQPQQLQAEQQLQSQQRQPRQQVTGETVFTQEELAWNDGSGGKPAYVAVNDIVYDMSAMIGWAGGTHFGQYAGKDLTNEFMICHKGTAEILSKLPKAGMLKQD